MIFFVDLGNHLLSHFCEPRMIQQLFSRISFLLVFSHSFFNEIYCFWTNIFKYRFIKIKLTFHNKIFDILLSLSRKGISACKEHIWYNTYAPNINFLIVIFVQDELWSHIQWTSKHKIQSFFRVKETWKTKIRNFNIQIISILRFQ